MNHSHRLVRCTRGFTLIEVLVTLVVVGIGLVGALQCLSAAYQCNKKAHAIALSTMIAQNAIESIRSLGELDPDVYTTVPTSNGIKTVPLALNEPLLPNGRLVITIDEKYNTSLSLKKITADVYWNGVGKKEEHTSLETVLGKYLKHGGG